MKSKSLFSAILTVVVFSQFSFPVFAADNNKKLFDKAWDNAVNSKQNTVLCRISIPTAKINPDLVSSMSAEDKSIAKLDIEALKHTKSDINVFFSEKNHVAYFWSKSLNQLDVTKSYINEEITFKEALSFFSGALHLFNMDVIIGYGDKIYYRLDKEWKVFEDHEFASKEYDGYLTSSLANFVDKSTLVFSKKSNGLSVYKGKASASITSVILGYFIGSDLAKNAKSANIQLFITPKGDWKKFIIETNFNYYNVVATVKDVCTFDFGDKKVPVPSNATPVDKETGLKELG